MFPEESTANMRLLLGRAFLHELEMDNTEMAVLFARAFLVHVMTNGGFGDNAS